MNFQAYLFGLQDYKDYSTFTRVAHFKIKLKAIYRSRRIFKHTSLDYRYSGWFHLSICKYSMFVNF